MANWTFNPNDYEERDFTLIPEGNYRVRIHDVVEKTFRSGNAGYEITLDVSGYASKLWFYLVLNTADVKQTNQNIGAFFNSFGIVGNQMGTGKQWIGKVGAARVKHEEYNGQTSAKVQYLIAKSKQDSLPPWQEKGNSAPASAPAEQGFVQVDDEELPFN